MAEDGKELCPYLNQTECLALVEDSWEQRHLSPVSSFWFILSWLWSDNESQRPQTSIVSWGSWSKTIWRNAMEPEHLLDEHLYSLFGWGQLWQSHKTGHCGRAVLDGEDDSLAIWAGQAHDKVYGDVRLAWNWQPCWPCAKKHRHNKIYLLCYLQLQTMSNGWYEKIPCKGCCSTIKYILY